MTRIASFSILAGLGLWAGCGQTPAQAPEPQVSAGDERAYAPAEDSLQVSGLKGTLSQDEVQGALEPRMLKFARCVQKRADAVEWLSGAMTLEFQVRLDGSVASVFPRESSMGDRETERCALEVAKATHFPPPRGGEAEFTWSFEVPLDGSIRPPEALPEDLVGAALEAQRDGFAACGSGPFGITAYVDPEGHVVAAGASASDTAGAELLDCVTDAALAMSFENPGSYAAKVQFSAP